MTISEIEKIVCSGENASVSVIHCPGRKKEIIHVKYIIIRLAHELGLSEYKIADYYGCDHATVNIAKRRVMELYQTEPEYANKIDHYRMLVLHAKHSKKYDIPVIIDQLDKLVGKINFIKDLIIS